MHYSHIVKAPFMCKCACEKGNSLVLVRVKHGVVVSNGVVRSETPIPRRTLTSRILFACAHVNPFMKFHLVMFEN